jgi:RNA-directed DNA polymerase
MSLIGHDTPRPFQPPVTQRDIEAEVICCVGGVLSPLLANIALSALDEHFMRQWQANKWQRDKRRNQGLGNWRLIRYADDFVVMISGERRHAEALRAETAAVLAPLGLRLAEERTRTVHIGQGFDFLGFTIRKMRKRGTQKHYVYTIPSKTAVQAAKKKVSAKTYRSTRNQDPATLIASISRFLAGWAGYFRHGVSSAVFDALDHHAWIQIVRWLRRKYHRRRSRIGMPEIRRRFCLPGTWKLAVNGVRFTGTATVPPTRYRYRGSKIPAPFTPQPQAAS